MTEEQRKIGEARMLTLSKMLANAFRDRNITRDEAVEYILALREKAKKLAEAGNEKRV